MSKNTVKPSLTRKRAKRVVENSEFDAFTRRILRAYARRVANGDVEALRSLAGFSSVLDTALREAVKGLRGFGYSWAEIADRLGVSRQAAQMRFGASTDRGALDRRLVEAGLGVTVATLVEVFADHFPGSPAPSACPGCGYEYPDGVTDCPSNAAVRPVLYRRRGEDKRAVARLTDDQRANLYDEKVARRNRAAVSRAARPARPDQDALSLFSPSTSPGGESGVATGHGG
jgi:hypothetical protein